MAAAGGVPLVEVEEAEQNAAPDPATATVPPTPPTATSTAAAGTASHVMVQKKVSGA